MRKRQSEDRQSLQPFVQPQLLSIPEVASILSIGRPKVYDLIKREGLPLVRLGNVTRVSIASLPHWIEPREQAS